MGLLLLLLLPEVQANAGSVSYVGPLIIHDDIWLIIEMDVALTNKLNNKTNKS